MNTKNQLQEATPEELKSVVYFFITSLILTTVLLTGTIWSIVRMVVALK